MNEQAEKPRSDEEWMQEALQEAQRAALKGEVPVGCIIVKDNVEVVRAHNLRETSQDPTAHAEILALRQASETLGRWRLHDATLYVTLEPCPMCAGALVNARISRLVFGCHDPKAGGCETLFHIGSDERLNHRFEIVSGVKAEESAEMLRSFFRARRKQKPLEKKQASQHK